MSKDAAIKIHPSVEAGVQPRDYSFFKGKLKCDGANAPLFVLITSHRA